MRMFYKWLVLGITVVALSACGGGDEGVSSGGGNTIPSDGGANSAQFAGTYKGLITTLLRGDSIDDQTSTDDLTIVIRTDGTASITIDGETVNGTVNGNQVGFSIRIVENEGLIECDGVANVTGSVNGNVITGSVDGSGECELFPASTGLTISGSFTASKTN